MNPTGKKFISLFLVFSLMMLSVNLYAKEKRGAKLLITKTDVQQIEGELIAVKPNSLLLLSATGRDVSVDIANIKVIRVVKKSGAGVGFLIGGVVGLLSAFIFPVYIGMEDSPNIGLIVSPIGGALLGAVICAAAGIDKTIQIEGKTDSEIQEALDNLSKNARVRDYESYLRTKPITERKKAKDTLQTVKEGDLIPLGSVDIPPVPIKKVIPPYPRSAKIMKREGTVVLNVLISEKGEVLNTYILKGIKGSLKLNEVAQKAAQQWKFMPAMKDGVPVKVWKQIAIKFREK